MKDPAFLFYSSDFLSGTMLMSDEEIGQYIKLLCLQHQKGHLKEKDMLNICKRQNEEIFSKFKKDEEGNYYNERLENEIGRRKAYSESRRNNRKKKVSEEEKDKTYDEDMKNICNSYEEHMGTETETITININNKDRDCKEEEKKQPPLNDKDVAKIEKIMIETIGTTNINNIKECIEYLEKIPLELVEYALRKTARIEHPSWQYTIPILESYVDKGFKSIEEVKADDLKHRTRNSITPQEETEEQKKARKIKELEEAMKNGDS